MAVDVATVTAIIAIRVTLPSVDLDRLPTLIPYAAEELSESALGDRYNKAVALLTLHWIYKDRNAGGGGGAITSEREGDLARSYATPANPTDYDGTSWGMELQGLIRRTILGVRNQMV
jgi:hypothetical protein